MATGSSCFASALLLAESSLGLLIATGYTSPQSRAKLDRPPRGLPGVEVGSAKNLVNEERAVYHSVGTLAGG